MDAVANETVIEAEYTLEAALKCPSCQQMVTTLQVVRLLRTKVNFTSHLPRRGYAIGCSECGGLLSANISLRLGI